MTRSKIGVGFSGRYGLGTGFLGVYSTADLPTGVLPGMTAYDLTLDQLLVVNNSNIFVPIITEASWGQTCPI